MAKYEIFTTDKLNKLNTTLATTRPPELVYLEDPAFLAMTDFLQQKPHTILETDSMDCALNEMKVHGVHLLLVTDNQKTIVGVVASEDILGEKPIQILQERRVKRDQLPVKLLMTPIEDIPAISLKKLNAIKVGHIVNTLKACHHHFILVYNEQGDENQLRGIFTTSQISRQLHQEVSSSVSNAKSLSELQKRHQVD